MHTHRTTEQEVIRCAKQVRYNERKALNPPAIRRQATRIAFGLHPLRTQDRLYGVSKTKCTVCGHQHPMSSDQCAQKNCLCIHTEKVV